MKKQHPIITRSAAELAAALGLPGRAAGEFEVRTQLVSQVAQIIRRRKLTHAAVAKAAGTSRTRLTAILNRNTQGVSTDLLLRIVAALGYTAKLTLVRRSAA